MVKLYDAIMECEAPAECIFYCSFFAPCGSIFSATSLSVKLGPRSPLNTACNRLSEELFLRRTDAVVIRSVAARRAFRLACHSSQVQSVLTFVSDFTANLLAKFFQFRRHTKCRQCRQSFNLIPINLRFS